MAENAPLRSPRPQPRPNGVFTDPITETTDYETYWDDYSTTPPEGVLNYPLNGENQKAWMRFIPVERADLYGGGSVSQIFTDSTVQSGAQGLTDFITAGAERLGFNTEAAAEYFKKVNSPELSARTLKLGEYRINLYMPRNIQINDGVNYSPVDLNIMGAGLEAGIKRGGDITGAVIAAAFQGGASIIDMINKISSGTNVSADVANIALLRSLRSVGADGARGAVRSATGVSLNPNVRSLLSGVNLRDFSFTFDFIPESEAESKTVQQIIDTFRTELYPESIEGTIDDTKISFGYRFPRMYIIKFYYGENEIPIDIKPVNLKNMATTYNSANFGWHKGGHASEIQMTLTFGEDRTLDKQSVRYKGAGAVATTGTTKRRGSTDRYGDYLSEKERV